MINKIFKTNTDCIKYLEQVIWENKPRCPYCQSYRQTPLPREQRYHCNLCRCSYSITAKTLFHKTKVDLSKWFVAIPLVLIEKISARKLAITISVTKDTACFMVSRILLANKEQPEFIKHFLN